MTIGRLPNESAEHTALRDELQKAEIELRDQRERVAELRRTLPLDTVIADHVLSEVRAGLDAFHRSRTRPLSSAKR